MVDGISQALNAYQQTALRAVFSASPANEPEAVAPQGTFTDMVRSVVKRAEDDNRHAEVMSMKAIQGTADIQEVVMAVSNAEVALQTVVAVRDKVVSAYQEIMQMGI